MGADHQSAQEAREADHQQHQAQRIAEEQARLTQHHQANMASPKPTWAPPPVYRTREQIETEARQNVQRGYEQAHDEAAANYKIAKEDHTRESLNLPPAQTAYEARKAAYLKQIEQRRQQNRDQEHDRD